MSHITAIASGDGWGGNTWSISICEPRYLKIPWRAYRGLREKGRKNESLTSVLKRARAMHKANMLVCGRKETPLTQIIFFDACGRSVTPPGALSELDLHT